MTEQQQQNNYLTLSMTTNPRSFIISSSTNALILRPSIIQTSSSNQSDHHHQQQQQQQPHQIIVEFITTQELNQSLNNQSSPPIRLIPIWGCLGLIEIEREIYLIVISHATPIGSIDPTQPDLTIHRVLSIQLFCLTSSSYDTNQSYNSNSNNNNNLNSQIPNCSDYSQDSNGGDNRSLNAINGIKKIVSNGQFYFSRRSEDLSSNTQSRILLKTRPSDPNQESPHDSDDDDRPDSRFSWNKFILVGLRKFRAGLSLEARLRFDQQRFLISVIQGFVSTYELKLPPPPPTQSSSSSSSSSSDNNQDLDEIEKDQEDLINYYNRKASEEKNLNQRPINLTISLFSRLGSKRAGTRFNTRGIDDDGEVANFVETETSISIENLNLVFSFVQIRGSVPIFFEQSGTGVSNVIGGLSGQGQKINLTRGNGLIGSKYAFEKHFRNVLNQYRSVQVLNLLSNSKEGEITLSKVYSDQLNQFITSQREAGEDLEDSVGLSKFDLHQRSRVSGLEGLKAQILNDQSIIEKLNRFGYFLCRYKTNSGGIGDQADRDNGSSIEIIKKQEGVFRTNCLDCLDRTNVVQEILSRILLESIFMKLKLSRLITSDYLWSCHRSLWADNGDVLSKIYSGTGALNTSFTRGGKQTISGILSNASKSVSRMYNSNFVDKSKQANIDLLLGNLNQQRPVKVFDPITETKKNLIKSRESEFSFNRSISIWAGSYNLNGRSPPINTNNSNNGNANSFSFNVDEYDYYYDYDEDDQLLNWLLPVPEFEPDIMVIGFQEIVKLSPQQIMITDPEKKRRWESTIMNALENRNINIKKKEEEKEKGSDGYVILRSEQLVGIALIILVKSELVSHIRSVEATTKKTGLKGISGNKGAVGIRLQIFESSLCFITSHFASGQGNVEERDQDFETIFNGLEFLKRKRIGNHENIIWLGDFNYRIDGFSNFSVRKSVEDGSFLNLLEFDQLLSRLRLNLVFPNFLEGKIRFEPTYKYDIGTDRYDTSEKQRIPAWTDRILYRGKDMELINYSRAELKGSDHRPVYAIFRVEVRVIDKSKKESIKKEISNGLEVSKVKDEVLGGFLTGSDSQTNSEFVDEWWKTSDYPDGSYEPNKEEISRVSKDVVNPFAKNFFLPGLESEGGGTPSSEPNLSVDQLSLYPKRRSANSAPSSPPRRRRNSSSSSSRANVEMVVVKKTIPALPARPSSFKATSSYSSSSSKTLGGGIGTSSSTLKVFDNISDPLIRDSTEPSSSSSSSRPLTPSIEIGTGTITKKKVPPPPPPRPLSFRAGMTTSTGMNSTTKEMIAKIESNINTSNSSSNSFNRTNVYTNLNLIKTDRDNLSSSSINIIDDSCKIKDDDHQEEMKVEGSENNNNSNNNNNNILNRSLSEDNLKPPIPPKPQLSSKSGSKPILKPKPKIVNSFNLEKKKI